jgi:hypothetical protein
VLLAAGAALADGPSLAVVFLPHFELARPEAAV